MNPARSSSATNWRIFRGTQRTLPQANPLANENPTPAHNQSFPDLTQPSGVIGVIIIGVIPHRGQSQLLVNFCFSDVVQQSAVTNSRD